jgi:sugar lactone lactonase YvrE
MSGDMRLICKATLVAAIAGLGSCGGGTTHTRTAADAASESASLRRGDGRLTEDLVIKGVGFMTPESVLYDAEADLYLVSNIEGSALAADDKAFISRLNPDGSLDALKWIDSAMPGVALDAPKGMAIARGVLYVADITHVRKFDRKSGKPLGSITIPGATFLNDITVDAQGNLLVSDSGLTTGFSPSGTDAVYRIDASEQISPLIKTAELGRPNGLLASADGLWVVSFGSGELYKLSEDGQRSEVQRLPKGSLDGIVAVDGGALVSSWEGSAIYRWSPDGAVELMTGLNAPADIGLDTKRKRVLIPLFNDDAVVIHQL